VLGEQIEHVVEKADACSVLVGACAVEAKGDRDLRLARFAVDGGMTWVEHGVPQRVRVND